MKAQLKKRPESRRIRTESGNPNRKANALLGEEYFKKGKTEQLGGNYERAIEHYMLAVTCKPNYFQAFCNMGYCYRALSKFGEAKRSYQSALYSNPNDHISHYNLANLYRVIGENEQAIEEYTRVISLKQQGVNVGSLYLDSLVNIGICFKNRGEIDQAIRINRKVLEEDPFEPSAVFNLAICLLNSIQAKNSPYFHKFYHERATEAETLFQRVLNKTPDSVMAKFCLTKVSIILDSNPDKLQAGIVRLKELLENPKCDIKDEISQQLGRYLNLQKRYGESARYYQNSVGGISRKVSRKNVENNKIDNIFETFSQENLPENDILDSDFLNESEGVNLIEAGNFKKVKQKLSGLPEGLMKHTLELALELKLTESDADNAYSAIALYNKYFNKSEQELPFQKISLEGHKAIGKVLSLQQNYEKAIKHYEYISNSIKNNRNTASAKLHSELGERFEEAGNRQKALEEYKKGIQIEPDNYSLSYSMGYCHYENGSYEEAKAYFDKIIQRIRTDTSLTPDTRELYETDCMIICALCTIEHSATTFDLFTDAFKKLQKLQSTKQSAIEMEEENLLLFFIRVSELYEEKISSVLHNDPQFKGWAEMLVSIYQSLLELSCCPDRHEVLINCGNLSYQLGHYASAVEAYSQVSNPQLFPALNLALAYAHLIEPMLALKYIQQACQFQPKETLNAFCREVMEWIYLDSHSGQWNKHLPSYKKDLFYVRNEFGICLLDKLSQAINNPDFQPKAQDKLLESLAKHHERIKSHNSLINMKLQQIESLCKKYSFIAPAFKGTILSPEILKLCFSKSNNASRDLAKLVELLRGMPACGRESEFCESALYLFIYHNQLESQAIQDAMIKFGQRQKHHASLISSQLQQKNTQIYSIYPDFTSAKEAIVVLKEWEALLEPFTREILKILEDIYYQGKIMQPLEFEYHFPRHGNLQEEDETFEKFITFALRVIKYDKKLVCRGANVQEMRNDLIKEFETHFKRYLQANKLHPITISQNFLPLTVYAVHETKQDCQTFLNEISKRLKVSEVKLHECDEAVIVINRLIRIRCRWSNPYEISSIVGEVMDSILDNPLFMVNQAIIYLENIISIIREDSSEAKKYISLDSTLNF